MSSGWMPPASRLLVGTLVAVIGPAVIALGLLPVRDHIEGAVVGLAFVLPTAIAAAIGGPAAAAVAVVLGTSTYNFLFTQPFLTFRVAAAADVAGLVVHSLVATAVSLVVVREQRAAHEATRRESEAASLRVLGEIDRVRTALLGAVSHDLRTPLAAIAAAASDLRTDEIDLRDDDRDVLAGIILEQTQRLDRTVANLLDAGRLQAGAFDLAAEPVDVDDLLAEACAAGDILTSRVRLELLPQTPPVFVDPVLAVAALRNLLENAIRHVPDGDKVSVVAAGAGGNVVIEVRDNGPGVPEDLRAQLFEPFAGDEGAGLGLAIARGFVEANGGRVAYQPGPEGGSIFEVVLPAAEEPDA